MGQLKKVAGGFRPFRFFLVFEIHKSLFPRLRQDPFQPLGQVYLGIIGSAQAQVTPGGRADNFGGGVFVRVRGTQAKVPAPQEVK